MASAKIASLVIRTAAKPIATHLKLRAETNDTFRHYLHRAEMRMRSNLLPGINEPKIRPLNDAKRDKIEEDIEALRQEIRDLQAHPHPDSDNTPQAVEDKNTLTSLVGRVHVLWLLAERHGWMHDANALKDVLRSALSDSHADGEEGNEAPEEAPSPDMREGDGESRGARSPPTARRVLGLLPEGAFETQQHLVSVFTSPRYAGGWQWPAPSTFPYFSSP
ncbi:hypothetical protein MSPP1_002647 [Malassezia sp. CBS 17886]|nr:hypothetical protein MSPP1_002647 [Malassezia sp. CBS 17886]